MQKILGKISFPEADFEVPFEIQKDVLQSFLQRTMDGSLNRKTRRARTSRSVAAVAPTTPKVAVAAAAKAGKAVKAAAPVKAVVKPTVVKAAVSRRLTAVPSKTVVQTAAKAQVKASVSSVATAHAIKALERMPLKANLRYTPSGRSRTKQIVDSTGRLFDSARVAAGFFNVRAEDIRYCIYHGRAISTKDTGLLTLRYTGRMIPRWYYASRDGNFYSSIWAASQAKSISQGKIAQGLRVAGKGVEWVVMAPKTR